MQSTGLRACEAARATGINVNTIRSWTLRELLAPCTHDHKGRPLYRAADVLQAASAVAERQAAREAERLRRVSQPAPVRTPVVRERQELVSYNAVHQRLKRDRGSASARSCTKCGWPAQDWAYDHEDPAELQAPEGRYSLDQGRYLPLCRPCHKALDHRAAA